MIEDGKDCLHSADGAGAAPGAEARRYWWHMAGAICAAVVGCGILIWVWQSTGDAARQLETAAVRDLDRARNPQERVQAIQALLQSGLPNPGAAISSLVHSLGDPDVGVRVETVRALGPAASVAARTGADESAAVAIASVLDSVTDPQPAVRIAAAIALGSIAATQTTSRAIVPQELVRALARMLDDRDRTVRASAIASLGLAGSVAATDPPAALVAILEDRSSTDRTEAAGALARFDQGYDRLVAGFAGAIATAGDDAALRTACLEALRRMRGKLTAAAVPALLAALKNPDREVRHEAVVLLERLGPDAREAIPALIAVLKRDPIDEKRLGRGDPNADSWDPGSKAAHALVAIAGHSEPAAQVAAALAEVINSGHPERRHAAASALRSGLPKVHATMAVPALIRMLRESDAISYGYDIGSVAAMALGGLAPGTPSAGEAVTALTVALRSEAKRIAALDALSRFGTAARGAVPRVKALKDQDPNANVRRAATNALTRIESANLK